MKPEEKRSGAYGGLGGFQIEYTLLVKKDGCEKLFPHDRELMVLK